MLNRTLTTSKLKRAKQPNGMEDTNFSRLSETPSKKFSESLGGSDFFA